MQNDFYYKLIAKRFTKEISDEENVELNKWINESKLNKDTYDKLSSVWQKSEEIDIDFNPDIKGAINIFKERARIYKKQQQKIVRLRVVQIAASILILFGLSFFLNSYRTVKVVTDNTGIKQIVLPDSSLIYLNKNSSISYAKAFKKSNVILNGEAFFEVKKQNGKPFIVKSKNTYTKVLGTSFNIKSRKENSDIVQLSLFTGKVEFSDKKKEKLVLLYPNQQVLFNKRNDDIVITEIKNKNILAWKTGKLIFKNNTLDEVSQTLSDIYDIKFKVTNEKIYDLKVTCEFNNKKIEDILNDLQIILPVRIELNNKLAVIKPLK